MNKKSLYHIIALIFLVISTQINAADKNEAIFNKVSKSYLLLPDGSQQMRVVKELTIFTHTAMNGTYGESFITYNPLYQELTINKSYTKQKDGNIVETPANAFVPVLPRGAADAPEYNYLKEMVVVHTGLELGATIYLDYTITTKKGYLNGIDLFEIVMESSPVKDYTLTVTIPKEKTLNYLSINSQYKPTTKEEANNKSYIWNIKNIPASSKSQWVSIQSGGIKVISANTYITPKEMVPNTDTFKSGTEYKNALATLNGWLKERGNNNIVASTMSIIKERFQLIPLNFKEVGFSMRSFEEIFNSAYGTEAELTFLAKTLMEENGVKCDVIMCYPTLTAKALSLSSISEFLISTDVADNEIVSVKKDKEEIKYIENKFISFCSANSGEMVDNLIFPERAINCNTNISLSEENLTSLEGGYYIFNFPSEKNSLFNHYGFKTLNTQRTENILLPYPISESYSYTINISPYSLSTNKSSVLTKVSNKVGEVEISIINGKNGTITITKKININTMLITPTLYKDFRNLSIEWYNENNNKLLFKK